MWTVDDNDDDDVWGGLPTQYYGVRAYIYVDQLKLLESPT